jgi:hypothetical protein
MSQGRKRGYAGVIATQRLSKLHKDAAAEANNVIIGRTWLDADQVRAGDALGLSKADRLKMRDVGQGEFYAFGPALGQPGVVHFCSDQVRTTHPRERADFRLVLHHENDCDASTESGAEERQPTHARSGSAFDWRNVDWSAAGSSSAARFRKSRPVCARYGEIEAWRETAATEFASGWQSPGQCRRGFVGMCSHTSH